MILIDELNQIKEILDKNILDDDFIITIPIAKREGDENGRKEVQIESSGD